MATEPTRSPRTSLHGRADPSNDPAAPPQRRGRGRRILVWSAALFALTLAAIHRRIPPPVFAGRDATSATTIADGTADETLLRHDAVAIERPDGARLRGIFVPADAEAPVVLHLLEADGSVAAWWMREASRGREEAVTRLADLGFASLLVDYRGVGLSEGEARLERFEGDVRAMWDEAVAHAGGDARRVFVRATSLGTVGVMTLLRDGVRPAGMVLIAPVDADGVAAHFASIRFGRCAQWLTAWCVAPLAAAARPHERLGLRDVATFVVASRGDELWPGDEQDDARARVVDAGGEWRASERPDPGDDLWRFSPFANHLYVVCGGRVLSREESAWWAARRDPARVDGRMELFLQALPPELGALVVADRTAAARCRELLADRSSDREWLVAWLALLHVDASVQRDTLDGARACRWEAAADEGSGWRERVDLSDPAGPLPAPLVVEAFDFFHFVSASRGVAAEAPALATVVEVARGVGAPHVDHAHREWRARHADGTAGVAFGRDLRAWWSELLAAAPELAPADGARRFLRVLLKGAGIPDRVQVASDGSITLQARDGERWVVVDPSLVLERAATDPPAPPR